MKTNLPQWLRRMFAAPANIAPTPAPSITTDEPLNAVLEQLEQALAAPVPDEALIARLGQQAQQRISALPFGA